MFYIELHTRDGHHLIYVALYARVGVEAVENSNFSKALQAAIVTLNRP